MRPIAILGAPSSAGAYAPGQELAPQALRDIGLVGTLRRHGLAVGDHGDLPVRRWRTDVASPRARSVDRVVANIAAVRAQAGPLIAAGQLVLVLGGDCTTGLGTIAALADQGPAPGLIYLDLHADMNTPASVIDGALDWMGLAHALDLPGCVPEVAATCSLTPDQIVLLGFGADHATAFEREQIARLAPAIIDRDALARDPEGAAAQACTQLGDRPALAVHFDVDLIDFNDAPLSEHAGANQGVAFDQALAALTGLLRDPRVCAVTVTELNPQHGEPDGSTLTRFSDALARACAVWAAVG